MGVECKLFQSFLVVFSFYHAMFIGCPFFVDAPLCFLLTYFFNCKSTNESHIVLIFFISVQVHQRVANMSELFFLVANPPMSRNWVRFFFSVARSPTNLNW